MGLLSGLDKVGLGKLEEMDVYDEEKKKEATEAGAANEKPSSVKEEEVLFSKSYTCPVCDQEFHSKMVRTGRVRLLSSDTDLRPKYQSVDSLKYDVIACPNCGYASLSRFFKFMLPAQAKMIRDNITKSFKGIDTESSIYSYDEAIMRHQLALANTVVKKANTSEKAYTCLKMAWLYRGKAESLAEGGDKNEEEISKLNVKEAELLKKACEGFKTAFATEEFPMCGMDEITLMYLIAELCRRTGQYEESGRWISKVLTSRGANERIKNKARDVKEMLENDKKAQGKK